MKSTFFYSLLFLIYCYIGNVKSTQEPPITDDLITERDDSDSLEETDTFNSVDDQTSEDTDSVDTHEIIDEADLLESEVDQETLENYQSYKEFTVDQLYHLAPRDFKKPRGIKAMLAKKIIKLIKWVHTNDFFKKRETCEEVKKRQEPEARLHSPVKTFGYPEYDTTNRQNIVRSRLSLNKVNGFRVPIHVGAEDWVLVGTFEQIREFLFCFSDYKVIASTLTEDGKWKSDLGDEGRHVYVQLQNVGVDPHAVSIGNLLWRSAVDRLLRRLRPDNIILKNSDVAMKALAEYYPTLDKAAITVYSKFMKGMQATKMFQQPIAWEKLWKKLLEADSFEKRCRVFHEHINFVDRLRPVQWEGAEHVNIHETLILTLSSYPRPEGGCRSTRRLDSSQVTLSQVWNAVEEFEKK